MRGNTIKAKEGCVFTNGSDFGRVVYLTKDDDGESWYEVEERAMEMAEEADYLAALQRFGVKL